MYRKWSRELDELDARYRDFFKVEYMPILRTVDLDTNIARIKRALAEGVPFDPSECWSKEELKYTRL
jgi:hypothetical protein